jgi:hypothetical protein
MDMTDLSRTVLRALVADPAESVRALELVQSVRRKIEAELAAQERVVELLQEKWAELAETEAHLRRFQEAYASINGPESLPPEAREAQTVAVRPKTVDGVVAILTDLGGSGSLDDIRREFRERGWLDPSFRNPDAALYAATKRLSDSGRIVRLGGGQYQLRSEQPAGSSQAVAV